MRTPLLAGLLAALLLPSCAAELIETDPRKDKRLYTPTSALKDRASFPIGVAVQSGRIGEPAYAALINKEFSSITAEYEMKQDVIHTGEDTYDWATSDAIVDFAVANGLRVHGHALVWHGAQPALLDSYSGSNAAFELMMKTYVQTVVARYKGRVASWDVVNEAFEDGSGASRNSIYFQKLGPDYIARCLQWAHEADPTPAVLQRLWRGA